MSSQRSSIGSANERSPLVSPQQELNDNDQNDVEPLAAGLEWEDRLSESKSSFYLFILTLGVLGLQIVWSVEMSNGSPYLLSLGMSKSVLAMVWIAGPLTGVLVQPYIGVWSDNCRVPWGKRKPFILAGGAATIVSLALLAWIGELVGGLLAVFGVSKDSSVTKVSIIFFATLAMYALDFSINTVQAGLRAFIVDNAPAHQQEAANAWASISIGVGNVVGFVVAYLDLPNVFPYFGKTQFKVLGVVSSIALGTTLLISCLYIKERDPRLEGSPVSKPLGVVAFFKQVFRSIQRLPPQIRKVCEVQFFSWIGWFPFLFYITTYVGQLYVNPLLEPGLPETDLDKLWEKATRVGTFALLINSIVTFVANIVLPFLVEPNSDYERTPGKPEAFGEPISPTLSRRTRRSSSSELPYSSSAVDCNTYSRASMTSNSSLALAHHSISHLMSRLRVPHLSLRRTWILSQLFFALCMFSTFLISTPAAATIMVMFVGLSWAVSLWIPFALISAEVAQQDESRRRSQRRTRREVGRQLRRESQPQDRDRDQQYPRGDVERDPRSSSSTIEDLENQPSNHHSAHTLLPQISHYTSTHTRDPSDPSPNQPTDYDQAGMILGLHNVAISFPQILATLISSVVFKVLQKNRGVPGDTSIGWVLKIGGVASLLAAWWARGLAEKNS